MANVNKPCYNECDGFKIPAVVFPEAFRSAINYNHQPGQLFLATYPKSGSTWLQHIIMLILRKGKPVEDEMDFLVNTPILDVAGAESVNIMNGPGVIKIHLPYNMIHTSPNAKYVYIIRNPMDCCVSSYFHTKNVPFYNFHDGTFDEYFELFVNGKTDYGDYFDNLLSWYAHKDDPNVHFVTFENLKRDTKGEVLKLAKFIGESYYNEMIADPKYVENVIHYSSSDYMKKLSEDIMNKEVNKPSEDESLTPGVNYYLGIKSFPVPLGCTSDVNLAKADILEDWRNYFSHEQVEKMEQWIKRRTEGSDVMSLWKD